MKATCAAGSVVKAASTKCTTCTGDGNECCTKCEAGKFRPSAKAACAPCGEGKHCGVGSAAEAACAAGHYCPNPSLQLPCNSAGAYCPAQRTPAEASAEGTCPKGFACTDATTKTPCKAGTYCPAGSAAATPCAKGKFSAKADTACADCPAGTYQHQEGKTQCIGACGVLADVLWSASTDEAVPPGRLQPHQSRPVGHLVGVWTDDGMGGWSGGLVG